MPSERPGNPIVRPPYQTLQRPKPNKPKPPPSRVNKPKKPKPASPGRSDALSGGGYNPTSTPGPPNGSQDPTGEVQDQPKHIKDHHPPIFTDARNRSLTPSKAGPSPALQRHGINRSVHDFNDTMEQSMNLFRKAHGRDPTPGLLYDIARSPLGTPDLYHLFNVPDSDLKAKAQGAQNKDRKDNPHLYLVDRGDNHMDLPDPLDNLPGIGTGSAEGLNKGSVLSDVAGDVAKGFTQGPIGGIMSATHNLFSGGAALPEAQPVHLPKPPPALRKYPWVSQASLPIPGADTIYKAISDVWNAKPLTKKESQLLEQGKTLSDYEYHMKQAQLDPLQKKYANIRRSVVTVKSAQEALQKLDPGRFKNLPANGYFTLDWARALKQYKASPLGAQQQTEYDAKQAGLNPHDYVQAWKNKQRLLRQHPQFYQMIAPMDLNLLVHPDSMLGSAGDLARHLTGGFHPTSAEWWIGLPFRVEGGAAKLAFSSIGDAVAQYKSYAAAMRDVVQMSAKYYGSHTKTKAEMDAAVKRDLIKTQTWATVFGQNLPNWADTATNMLGDLLLFGKVGNVTMGSKVPKGDIGKAMKSSYLNGTADMAWREVSKHGTHGVARAAAFLESESSFGAERLMEATAKDIASGKLSKTQFQALVAHQYAKGWVPYNGKAIHGDLLHSLWSGQLVPKNLVWQSQKARMRHVMNQADAVLADSSLVGTDAAQTLLNTTRNLWAHASPEGEFRYFSEPRLPQRIFDYAKSRYKDPKLGEKWQNQFVRARARDDVPGMQKVFDDIFEHDVKIYPEKRGSQVKEDFKALFSTENPSRGYFPGGGEKEMLSMFDNLSHGAKSINDWALKITAWHRHTIVSGAPIPGIALPPFGATLATKHAVADTLRRVISGGFPLKFEKAAYNEVKAFAEQPGNEALLRQLKLSEFRSKMSETRYQTEARSTDVSSFDTAARFKSTRHMTAAGGYLRRMFTDDAVTALSQSKPNYLQPLIHFLSRNKDYRHIAFSRAGIEKMEFSGPKLAKSRLAQEQALKDQAEAMWHRYAEIMDGGKAAGVADPLQAIRSIIHGAKGDKADAALGKWIKDNQVEFHVRSGQVEVRHAPLDGWTQTYIGYLMAPNKWNRAGMYKNVFAKTYKEMRVAGWTKADAAESAMMLAERQTAKHMLDFANMLKVEQDLRWASYFATKHRLYWNWVQNVIWRKPGYAVAARDFQHSLDDRGNWSFKVAGQKVAIPFPRLLWLNSDQLPAVSTPLVGVEGAIQGLRKGASPWDYAWAHASETSGNIVTRDDQAWIAFYHLMIGPKTYESAVGMMAPKQRANFNQEVNEYQLEYKKKHGVYAPEADATTWGLMHTMFHEGMRANFVIPTFPTGVSTKEYTDNQKKWNTYSRIQDPAKKYKYLHDHPELGAQIAQKSDPRVYQHNQEFFGRFRALSDQRKAARDDIYQKALLNGWDAKAELEWRQVGREFAKAMHQLELDDATKWVGSKSYPKGLVSDNQVVRPGPFGYALQGNPYLARKQLHEIFPNIPVEELKAKTIGDKIVKLQGERAFLNTKEGRSTYKDPQAVRDRLSEIGKELAHFQGYPKTAAEKFHARYFDQVNAYRDKRDAWRDRIANTLDSTKKDRAYEELRAWEDQHDKPLHVMVDGKSITFPSPVRVGFETSTPDEKRATRVRWSQDNWNHLSNFAKEQLSGVKRSPAVSRGQLALELFLKAIPYDGDKKAADHLLRAYGIKVQKLGLGESIDATQKAAIVTQIDRIVGANGAFIRDYNFAQKPTAARLKTYDFIKKDANWQDLFNQATFFLNEVKKAGYTGNEHSIKQVYRAQIIPQLKARVATEGSRFKHEVDFFVKQNPNFWNSLITP